ncbi:DNA adenine methylase [Neobacillus niacini]|uniref:DNA adenine methylase n=1 Tax=Neobacillus niacini TaxID=86668 RepID=UPI002781D35C|nr:DNA adenine methylase [Neobacillus niacini]MDQ1000062.1 DNA adenine methylase [Neobacillus niacini]
MMGQKERYYKSCFNYTGGKHKLLKQIEPLFPKHIDHFVDLFCGGANVAINANAKSGTMCIDNQKEVIRLYNTLKEMPINEVFETIDSTIQRFGLSNTFRFGYEKYNCMSGIRLSEYNKEKYLELREFYNKRQEDSPFFDIVFYVLTVFGFNNQIRFNKKGQYNIPVGKRDFNENIRTKLEDFIQIIKDKSIEFNGIDFRDVETSHLVEGDFLYADPPYLISTATYNEQNGWTEKEEKDLLCLLDKLHQRGVKFALSNVLEHKGMENTILINWADEHKDTYFVNHLDYNYTNSNYQIKQKKTKTSEVLITNYNPF